MRWLDRRQFEPHKKRDACCNLTRGEREIVWSQMTMLGALFHCKNSQWNGNIHSSEHYVVKRGEHMRDINAESAVFWVISIIGNISVDKIVNWLKNQLESYFYLNFEILYTDKISNWINILQQISKLT